MTADSIVEPLRDAKDERAAQFYASFGFMPLPGAQLSLFVPLKSILATIAALR